MERTCRKLGFDLYGKNKNPAFNFSKAKCGKVKGGIEIYRYTSPYKVRF